LDIQKLHVGYQYVISTPQFGKPQLSDLWVKVVYKGEEIVQKINVITNDIHTHREIKIAMYKEINDDYSGYETIFGVSYCTVNTTGAVYVDAKQTRVAFNSSDKKFYATGSGSTLYAVTSDTSQNITAKKTFTVLPESSVVPTTDNQLTNKKYVDDNKGQTIQYETMPTASADYLGKIVQYTGTTNANYTNGYFYVCVGTTENDVTTYSWSNVEVQASSGSNTTSTCFIDIDSNLTMFSKVRTGNPYSTNASFSSTMNTNLQTFLQKCYDNDEKVFNIIIGHVKMASDTDVPFLSFYTLASMQTSLLAKPTTIDFYTTDSVYTNQMQLYIFNLHIQLSWNGDTLTVSTANFSRINEIPYLSKVNTMSYTPTNDYHPATKKYVDDSIAAAITTTLGGSY